MKLYKISAPTWSHNIPVFFQQLVDTKDWLTDMGWKIRSISFCENRENLENRLFFYKIYFLKFEGGNRKPLSFPVYRPVVDRFFIQNSFFYLSPYFFIFQFFSKIKIKPIGFQRANKTGTDQFYRFFIKIS
jgi:hypothetical protein